MNAARLVAGVAVAVIAIGASGAEASWQSGSGSGESYAKARSLPAGEQPTAAVSGRDVTVSWAAPGGPVPLDGYVVKRYADGGGEQPIGANCAGTVTGLTCTERDVDPGDWQYTVAPTWKGWRGNESPRSGAVTVGSPSLTLNTTVFATLPATTGGEINNFKTGQTVGFRLDDPDTGPVLTGSINPSPVPSNGTASVSVTIPAGTSNGSHTVFAVGSAGDEAGADITVAAPVSHGFSTPAWSVSDQADTTPANVSDPYEAAGGPFDYQLGFQSGFDSTRYLEFDFNGPLPSGLPATGVQFNFDYLGANGGGSAAANTCFYLEVRRISTGSVLATHGSPASPVDCQNALSFKSTSTSLPEVATTDIANDLRIRVYMNNSLSGLNVEDRATVTGTQGLNSFTLYRTRLVNRASGTPTTEPWSLNAAGDGAFLTSSDWSDSVSGSRYLELTFPAYVPATATGISATLRHSYRSRVPGAQTCWLAVVFEGATAIAIHGGSSTPISCNSSTSFKTDTVPMPEVNTVSRANNLVIRIYAYNTNGTSSARESEHDLASVDIDYNG